MDAIDALESLSKGGPYVGPKGGLWADAKHTVSWSDRKSKKRKSKGKGIREIKTRTKSHGKGITEVIKLGSKRDIEEKTLPAWTGEKKGTSRRYKGPEGGLPTPSKGHPVEDAPVGDEGPQTLRRFKGPAGVSPDTKEAYLERFMGTGKGIDFGGGPGGSGEPGVLRRDKGPGRKPFPWQTGPKASKPHFLERGEVPPPHTRESAQAQYDRAQESAGRAYKRKYRKSIDAEGRPLIKGGLYSFRDPHDGKARLLPAAYLFDYLCAFVCEAYEHEVTEPAHKFTNVRDLPTTMARAIMGELVVRMTKDTNLRRACQKFKCTVDTIATLLVKKNILKTHSDAMPTDSDSAAAMGAGMLSEAEVMAYSKPSPWMQKSDSHVHIGVGRLVDRTPENLAHTLIDDSQDPHALVRKSIRDSVVEHGSQLAHPEEVAVTRSADCPVHAREIHKAMNLWNPMGPCTCGAEPNPYG